MSLCLVLVDDHNLVRQSLRLLLEQAGHRVVGEASEAQVALDVLGRTKCDLVLLDMKLPNHDGKWLIEQLRKRGNRVPVLVLSMEENDMLALRALQVGANGYVVKSASSEELLVAISTVGSGGTYLHSRVTPAVLSTLRNREALSEDERKLLRLVVNGRSNRDIASSMQMSVSAVKLRLASLFERFSVSTRTGLAAEAMRRGIVEGPPP